MRQLYHLPVSFNSRRVWIALLEKGLDFQLVSLNLDGVSRIKSLVRETFGTTKLTRN
ncbi:MAG: hypothetical protein N5P05_000993 [Chroococcopsis gigantea SAG 12.99]|jgi:glutathione S-transferase|nr:glutathione S-transferase N-terminal domain-containing protein [Chlorogloea purpurea SAG 13.99]MDV2999387.1 hypothetical protein [Chroococcopsis gigantea SAG 12.99]